MSVQGLRSGRPPKVLIADDETTSRMFAREALENSGFVVVEAQDGKQALEVFEKERPQLVLLDVDMPDMNGFEVCVRLRVLSECGTLPILMATGLDDVASIERAYEAGATDFVTKPVNWLILAQRLRYMLRASTALQDLSTSEMRLANAQRIAHLGHWEWDVVRGDCYWSEEAWRIIGLRPEDTVPSVEMWLERVHPDDRERVRAYVENPVDFSSPAGVSYRIVCSGVERVVQTYAEVHRNEEGGIERLSGTVQDITDRCEAEEKIRQLACADSLTGLSNRRFFTESLGETLEAARRRGCQMALMFLDIDNFKRINDTLGHNAGDELLREVAGRLLSCVRSSDYVARGVPQHVGRLGGDEFTVQLSGIRHAEDAAMVARRVLDAVSRPIALGGHEVVVTPSIGIAVFPEHGDNVQTLLQNADIAMYHAKKGGKNLYCFYADSMQAAALQRLTLESKLRRAFEQQEFTLVYQPQVSLVSGTIVGAEALLRWHDEELGEVSPEDFIPLAEESGLIVSLGNRVLREACAQCSAWRAAGLPMARMAVNLSALQFAQPGVVDSITQALVDSGLPPHCLEIEITESLLMDDIEGAISTLRTLKNLGVSIAIDDFGIGYSSLNYLKRLPLDRLKIDASFVRDITSGGDAAEVASAIISMAHSMKLSVTAEGVETAAQRKILEIWRCDELQGFHFSRPLKPADFVRLLREHDARSEGVDEMHAPARSCH